MSANCQQALDGMGLGVANALRAVDCIASESTGRVFGNLFAEGGSLAIVLTMLLTLYVAFFAISLMLGRSNLGVRSLTPRMITLGLVLTFATSWVAYQSVVWNLAIGGPDWLASQLTGAQGSATIVFADKIDVVFLAIRDITEAAGQGQESDISAFSPEGMLWMGAMMFLLGTVGVLVTARIALALLVALGPIFVVMVLFNGTRGLFTGWLKGVVMLALTPLFAVLGGSLMLELAVPILSALSQNPAEIDTQAAMAFFLVGAVHVALMVMVLKVMATMVSGWQVFGLASARSADKGRDTVTGTAVSAPVATPPAAAATTAAPADNRRRIAISGIATSPAANDAAAEGQVVNRQTNISVAASGAQVAPLSAANSRTRGIGNRFRAPPPRMTEKK